MLETRNKLETLLIIVKEYISKTSAAELNHKASPEKWSKKEILGHLVDSSMYNLQRFTEIQFEKKPYRIRPYNHVELVKVNDYQHAKIAEIVDLLLSINIRIKSLMILQTTQTLDYKIEYPKGTSYDNGTIYDLRVFDNRLCCTF